MALLGLLGPLRALLQRLTGQTGAKGLGRRGEAAAAHYLEGAGYTVLARNFHTHGGEADLVAAKDGLVHAVEVKTRANRAFGAPAEAVTPKKARRVLRAGRAYCRSKGISLSKLRCDVVAVEADAEGHLTVRHYPNAFADPPPRRR